MVKIITGNKEELEQQIADKFEALVLKKDSANVIFATGNSPVGFYKKLINKYKFDKLSFNNINAFNLDEYLEIEKYQDDAFRKFMDDNLFSFVDMDEKKINFPVSPKQYDNKLDKIIKFDFTILGVGQNGHIAFNEPGTSFNERTKKIVLTDSTIKANFGSRTEFPSTAITMGLIDIYEKSENIFLFAWGKNKMEALKKFNSGIKDDAWPITHFIDHPNITIITDLETKEIF